MKILPHLKAYLKENDYVGMLYRIEIELGKSYRRSALLYLSRCISFSQFAAHATWNKLLLEYKRVFIDLGVFIGVLKK
jgi:hypothetical protein